MSVNKKLHYSTETRRPSSQFHSRKLNSISQPRSSAKHPTSALPQISKSKKQRKKHSQNKSPTSQQSRMLLLKYLQLENYPKKFDTYSEFTNKDAETAPLLHRDKVTKILMNLDKTVQPILQKFDIVYSSLSESHPCTRKPAIAHRIPLKNIEPVLYAHVIQLRVRNPLFPNDVKKFYNLGTLLALLFHELAHISFMDHGVGFMLVLRDIYQYAHFIDIFPNDEHQLPSFRSWEKLIFKTRGNVSDNQLIELFNS